MHKMIVDQFIGYYLADVLGRQYVFADRAVATNFLYELAQFSPANKDAMCLLSSLHMQAMWKAKENNSALARYVDSSDWVGSNNYFFARVCAALGITATYGTTRLEMKVRRNFTAADAMVALHGVSSFLFSGGRGQWPIFLEVAMAWVGDQLEKYSPGNYSGLLVNANERERFITRTTFWFDVWGSITQRRQPRFMHVYRELFGNPGAYIGDSPSDSGPISMVKIVGCSNYSFRAIAEIATLAAWKDEKESIGQLSAPQLVSKGAEIEKAWLRPELTSEADLDPLGNANPSDSMDSETQLQFQRKVASEVFRASARVYLHMVLSTPLPQIAEIKEGVEQTKKLLERIPHEDIVNTTAIVRSVISAICICGCLTDDGTQKEFFLRRLDSLGTEADLFGNLRTVKELIKRVWKLRMEQSKSPVPVDWREVLLEDNNDVALLV